MDALGEVVEMAITALERSLRVKVAFLGIKARGGKPGVAVVTGTAQDPVLDATVCTENRAWSHGTWLINWLGLSSHLWF